MALITKDSTAVLQLRLCSYGLLSSWPQLATLDLSKNERNEPAMKILTHGGWSSLVELNLAANP